MKKIKGPIWYSVHPPTPQPTPSNKTFSSFQKGLFTLVFLKPREPFPIPIKWKEYSIGPLGSLRADSLRGIKQFQVSVMASFPTKSLRVSSEWENPSYQFVFSILRRESACLKTPKGSNWILFPFYCCRKRFSGFPKHNGKQAFLKTWKCFIPQRISRGVPLVECYH